MCLDFADYKLLVASGISNEGYTKTTEVIDPKEESSDSWNHLKQLPTKLDTPVSGYLSPDIPVICGK
jgi:hypothetical protein